MSDTFSAENKTDVFAGDPAAAPMPVAKRRGSSGTVFVRENLLLLAMPAIAAAVLYVLSLRGGPAAASAQQLQNELQVESAISTLSAAADVNKVKTQSILENFYHEAKQRQIPIDRLKGNPFIFKMPGSNKPAVTAAKPAETPSASVPMDTDLAAAMSAVQQLTLQLVLSGASGRSSATISNNLLTEGQTISGWTVSKIGQTEVTLTWRDQTYVLKTKE